METILHLFPKKPILMHNSIKPSNLESHIGFWLRFVSNQVSSRFDQQLSAHDISMTEWVALRTLYGATNETHSSLINALGMTKGAASKIISRLETKGLARRSLSANSLREQVLSLTDEGNKLVPQLAYVADENDAFFFGHLSALEQDGLRALMQKLVTHHQLTQVPTT